MNIEHFETLFSDSESDADRVWVASQKIHEALLNTGITDDALTQGLHIVIQRVNQLNYSTQFLPQNVRFGDQEVLNGYRASAIKCNKLQNEKSRSCFTSC